MRIHVGYDYAAWPVGGYYAYDEMTWDGDPESNGPFGWGKNESEAIEELAAQALSCRPYEDMTPNDLTVAEREADAIGDVRTILFIAHLREYIQ